MSKVSKAAPAPAIEEIEEDEGFDMEAVVKALVIDKMIQLPKTVQKRVRALKNLHGKYADQEKEYQKEIRELEFKYEKIFAPIFQKRATIIAGEYDPTEDEAKWDDEADVVAAEAEAKKAGAKPLFEETAKGIPKFWYSVMQNNPLVREVMFPADEEALSFLKDIRCTLLQGDQHGFDIDFHFAENPYFTNTVLKKTYHLIDDVEYSQLVFDHATGTKINWKAGKNLTVKLVTKRPKNPKKGGKKGAPAKPKVEEEAQDSFFNFFAAIEGSDEDDEEGFLDSMMEADFEVGCTFKDKLIPQSVRWYTGEAAQFDDYEDEDDEEGEFGEDDEDDELDEDDDDEDEAPARGGKRGGGRGGHSHEHGGHSHEHGGHDHSHGHKHGGSGKSFAPPGAAGAPGQPGQPECKQQ